MSDNKPITEEQLAFIESLPTAHEEELCTEVRRLRVKVEAYEAERDATRTKIREWRSAACKLRTAYDWLQSDLAAATRFTFTGPDGTCVTEEDEDGWIIFDPENRYGWSRSTLDTRDAAIAEAKRRAGLT